MSPVGKEPTITRFGMGNVLAVNEEAVKRPGMHKGRQAKLLAVVLLSLLLSGCSSAMRWAQDPPNVPSCVPDRLLTWEDFRPRAEAGRRAAETA